MYESLFDAVLKHADHLKIDSDLLRNIRRSGYIFPSIVRKLPIE